MSTFDLFPGFESHWVDTSIGQIFARSGGSGPPLLLVHGFPQTHVEWHRIAPELAKRFTLVMPDLPGYGWSVAPRGDTSHFPYAKRDMAKVLIESSIEDRKPPRAGRKAFGPDRLAGLHEVAE